MKLHEIKTRLLSRGYSMQDVSVFLSEETNKSFHVSTVKSTLERWAEKPAEQPPRGKKAMLVLIGVSILIGKPCSAHIAPIWHEQKNLKRMKQQAV
jgi:hypothetical protein